MKIRPATRAITLAMMLLALLGGSLSAVLPPAATAEATDVTVTWPSITAFNPDVYDYVVDIAYEGPGFIKVRDGYTSERVEPGEYRPQFGSRILYEFDVLLCLDGCTVVSSSPTLAISYEVDPGGDVSRLGPDRPTYRYSGIASTGDPVPFDVDWRVEDVGTTAPPLLSGSERGVTQFPAVAGVGVLVEGEQYRLITTVTVSGPEWGTLTRTVDAIFVWDTTPPADARLQIGYTDGNHQFVPAKPFYPVRDNYGDSAQMKVRVGEADHFGVLLTVVDASGDTVRTLRSPGTTLYRRWDPSWDGRGRDRQIVPEGAYTVVVRVVDQAGNAETLEGSVEVSNKRLTPTTFRRTVRADATVLRRSVGRCATLARPARANWPGSLGYRSKLPCHDESEATVVTTNGLRIPYSPCHCYGGMRVTATGGKAVGERSSYLVMYYLDRRDRWLYRTILDDAVGHHPGETVAGRSVILGDWKDKDPYVIWSVGLTDGAKYDVKSFTVELKYLALR